MRALKNLRKWDDADAALLQANFNYLRRKKPAGELVFDQGSNAAVYDAKTDDGTRYSYAVRTSGPYIVIRFEYQNKISYGYYFQRVPVTGPRS